MPPHPDKIERTMLAPSQEYLTVEQAAAFLGLRESEFLDRVALGVFPDGTASSLRDRQWPWATVYGLSLLRPWLDALYVERKRELRKQGKKAAPPAPGLDDEDDAD